MKKSKFLSTTDLDKETKQNRQRTFTAEQLQNIKDKRNSYIHLSEPNTEDSDFDFGSSTFFDRVLSTANDAIATAERSIIEAQASNTATITSIVTDDCDDTIIANLTTKAKKSKSKTTTTTSVLKEIEDVDWFNLEGENTDVFETLVDFFDAKCNFQNSLLHAVMHGIIKDRQKLKLIPEKNIQNIHTETFNNLVLEITSLYRLVSDQLDDKTKIQELISVLEEQNDHFESQINEIEQKLNIYEEVFQQDNAQSKEKVLSSSMVNSPVNELEYSIWRKKFTSKELEKILRQEVLETRSEVAKSEKEVGEFKKKKYMQDFEIKSISEENAKLKLYNHQCAQLQDVDLNEYVELEEQRENLKAHLETQTEQESSLHEEYEEIQARYIAANNKLSEFQMELLQFES